MISAKLLRSWTIRCRRRWNTPWWRSFKNTAEVFLRDVFLPILIMLLCCCEERLVRRREEEKWGRKGGGEGGSWAKLASQPTFLIFIFACLWHIYLLFFTAFTLVIVLACIQLAREGSPSMPKMFNIHGFGSLFGTTVYAFMCHHSLPSLVTPMKWVSFFL